MKPVKDFEGFYTISTSGSVYSILRKKIIAPWLSYRGYWMVSLYKNGKRSGVPIHRLLLLTYVGAPPEGKPHCCHFNGCKTDNRIENLRWGSVLENHLDKKRHGTFQEGIRHGRHKLTDDLVRQIRASAETHAFWSKRLNVTEQCIAYARKDGWKHVK